MEPSVRITQYMHSNHGQELIVSNLLHSDQRFLLKLPSTSWLVRLQVVLFLLELSIMIPLLQCPPIALEAIPYPPPDLLPPRIYTGLGDRPYTINAPCWICVGQHTSFLAMDAHFLIDGASTGLIVLTWTFWSHLRNLKG